MYSSLSRRRQRGSLLIVAMIFSAIIALVITTYIRMASTALNLSERGFCENSAMNLTESGLEQAMAAINANTWASPWSTAGSNATATFTGFTVGQNMSGSVKVFVQNYASSSPLVVAKGIVSPNTGASIYKMVEISGLVQRSLFAKGLVGRNGVSFSGNNASVDSWDSNPTAATGAYTPVAYSTSVRHDHGSIAAVNITATDAVGNADIWGSASVGGSSTSLISVGPQGLVGPFGTASGTKDSNSVSSNFTDNLPTITAPTSPGGSYALGNLSISGATPLPRGTDVAAADGKYYYVVNNISGTGNVNNKLNIGANVVLLFNTAAGSDSINLGGNASINIASGATLQIYTAGNLAIAGNGVANANASNATSSFQVWGTNASDPSTNSGTVSQSISIVGNGGYTGTVYAPNASLSITGNGDTFGSFVAWAVTMTGNAAFHYDENLGRQGNAGFFNPTKWRELTTSTDRGLYTSQLNF